MKTADKVTLKPEEVLASAVIRNESSLKNKVPAMKEAHRWVRELVNLLFPIRENRTYTREEMEFHLSSMKERLIGLVTPLQSLIDMPAEQIAEEFTAGLNVAYRTLTDDARYFECCDPASESLEEVIVSYPGFFALSVYRIAHILYKLKVPLLPRVISEYAHTKTGIDIHPGAEIGRNFFIDHGTGIVIGETTNIGENVKIYQGVTLGALYVTKEIADTKRHPTIEDNVIIYSGATILGGDTTVGKDTIIGGNVWLTESVAPGRIVYHENKTRVREKEEKTRPLNFII